MRLRLFSYTDDGTSEPDSDGDSAADLCPVVVSPHLADGYGGNGGGNGGGGGGGGGGGVAAGEFRLDVDALCGARCSTRLPIFGDLDDVGLELFRYLGESCVRLQL